MDSSFSVSSSRRTSELPKPETGLAEWTSKIKAMQREVDADEEAEQKRLEEEIAAAREARLRRSRGAGAGSRVDSMDTSSARDRMSSSNDRHPKDISSSVLGRSNDQETPLHQLMGRNEVYNPDKIVGLNRGAEKQDSLSLAAFIGGRATGPRLNKHAPQPDAHDPTQYIQPDLSAPHPIFGRGGIAMPGMTPKNATTRSSADAGSEHSERYRPSLSGAKSTSALGDSYLQKIKATTTVTNDESDLPRRSVSTGDPYNVTAPLKVQKTGDRAIFNSSPVREPSPVVEDKPLDDFLSNATTSPSLQKLNAPSTPSYLTEKKEPTSQKHILSSTKSNDNFRSSQTNFSSTPKTYSYSSSSYLPKKEEPSSGKFTASPVTSTDGFRPTSITASKPLPSYTGSSRLTKSTSTDPGTSKVSTATTPLRRLMETNNVYNPDKEPARKSVAERAQNVSLAGFMGGNAKGIRLNRPAPQPDVHDPTQFIQPDTSAPHPIFGRGGIAMPGMVPRKTMDSSGTQNNIAKADNSETYRPSSITVKKVTWPPVATIPQTRPMSPQKTGGRERTTSAPNAQAANVSTPYSSSAWSSSDKAVDRQTIPKASIPTTSIRDRTISGPSYHVSTTVSTPSRSSAPAPSLARPIQPRPKSTSFSPQLSSTATITSPAFQRPPPQKELTPSISRLQGRGFVQNILQAAKFETPASPSPSVDKPPRPLSAGGKRNSVLDRWQPQTLATSPSKSTFLPSSNTTHSPSTTQQQPRSTITTSPPTQPNDLRRTVQATGPPSSDTTKSLTEGPINPIEPFQRSRTPGLGSATTMVLIKPSKSVTDLSKLRHVDELGMKHVSGQGRKDIGQFNDPPEILPSSKKPLIHPTKSRPRKPRKASDVITSTNLTPEDNRLPEDESTFLSITNDRAILEPVQTTSPLTILTAHNDGLIQAQDCVPELPNSPEVIKEAREHEVVEISGDSLSEAQQDVSKEESAPRILPVFSEEEICPPISPSSPSFRKPSPLSPLSLPSSPIKGKHVRIPSTGSRPTVMEVAQTLLHHPGNEISTVETKDEPELAASPVEYLAKPRDALSQLQAERRRSSYEKYAAIILPSLKEEATPTPSPASTLPRAQQKLDNAVSLEEIVAHVDERVEAEVGDEQGVVEPIITTDNVTNKDEYDPISADIDVASLLKPSPTWSVSPDEHTISVEVLVITGTAATPLSRNLDVFYDSEILAIIHRTKSKSTGLANTAVWCWLGRKSILGDREGKKLNDLAKRYGTTATIVYQLAEPPELIGILGGQLAIRQGARAHWSSDNTTMHLIRSLHGFIIIDEHDLNIKNLCSAYSYCFTILGSIYVWHGCGSTTQEREAALKYARAFSPDPVTPIVLVEGEDDDDEIFWMILGNEEFARADYWRWRKDALDIDPMIWRVGVDGLGHSINPVKFISTERELHKSVYVVNFIWELFVLVGKEARGNRRSIKLAVDLAVNMASEVAPKRPYLPTVHVLIVPSQIPLDLRLGTRDLDEAWLNDGEIPDHMNLLNYSDAMKHLSTNFWEQTALKDPNMLPLGVGDVTA